jgi:hypothetical protein
VLAGEDPLEDLLDGVRGLAGITSGPESTDPPLELAGLPGVAGTGPMPALGDVLDDISGAIAAGELAVLRLSLGDVEQRVDGEAVSASAASLRLQLLTWGGYGGLSAQTMATGVFDLEVGLLQAAATAPAVAAQAPPGGTGETGTGTGGGTGLALTSSPVRVLAGAGAVLTVTGLLLLAATGRVRRTLIR